MESDHMPHQYFLGVPSGKLDALTVFLTSLRFMLCYLWAKPALFLICSQTFFGVLASLRREFISVEDMPNTLLHRFNNNEDNY